MTADDVMVAIRASGKPNYTYILMRIPNMETHLIR